MVRKNKILNLDEDIYTKFKIKCLKKHLLLRDVLENLMNEWINKK